MDYNDEINEIKLTAKKTSDNTTVHADHVTKADGPFYCPSSYEELIVRKCNEKRDHFAYKGRLSPTGAAESLLHKTCKEEICEAMKNTFPDGRWECERLIKDKTLKPDVSGIINKDIPIAIEVQASAYKIDKIIERTQAYNNHNIYLLWVIPLKEELGEEIFRPRLFERFLHTMYFGRVYYWNIGDGAFVRPVHFETAYRYIESKTWYENGEEINVGGYDKPYEKMKKPNFSKYLNIVDFKYISRPRFEVENEYMSVPECKIFMDKVDKWWE